MKIDLFYLVCFVFIKENHADVHILSSAINSSKSLEYNNDFMYLSSCLVIIWKRHHVMSKSKSQYYIGCLRHRRESRLVFKIHH